MAYIAGKPVRFDRNYIVGEIIPDGAIDPAMVRKLTDMGKIIHTDIPNAEHSENESGTAQTAGKPDEAVSKATAKPDSETTKETTEKEQKDETGTDPAEEELDSETVEETVEEEQKDETDTDPAEEELEIKAAEAAENLATKKKGKSRRK